MWLRRWRRVGGGGAADGGAADGGAAGGGAAPHQRPKRPEGCGEHEEQTPAQASLGSALQQRSTET